MVILRRLCLCLWEPDLFLVYVIFGYDYLSVYCQSGHSPLWHDLLDVSQHVLLCLHCLIKLSTAALQKQMFLLDWQPWDAGASLFIFTTGTAWKAALVPCWVITPAGILSQTKQRFLLLDLKFPWEISPGSTQRWVGQCSLRLRKKINTNSGLLWKTSRMGHGPAESPVSIWYLHF